MSHGSDYSRQACAEQIAIDELTGAIKQVEMTSCGLNNGSLKPEGTISATKACVISNGNMPHISNQMYEKPIPMVTNQRECHFIAGIDKNTLVGFKYFDFKNEEKKITLVYKSSDGGVIRFYQKENGKLVGKLPVVASDNWAEPCITCTFAEGVVS